MEIATYCGFSQHKVPLRTLDIRRSRDDARMQKVPLLDDLEYEGLGFRV